MNEYLFNGILNGFAGRPWSGLRTVSLIFSGIVSYLQEKLPRGITINAADHRIDVYPQRIKQIEKILSVAELSDITFGDNEVIVELIV